MYSLLCLDVVVLDLVIEGASHSGAQACRERSLQMAGGRVDPEEWVGIVNLYWKGEGGLSST